jgi:putative hemolysin
MDTIASLFIDHWPALSIAFAGILAAGLLAASETAIVYANKTRLHQLAESGDRRAAAALDLMLQRNRLHSALLVLENFLIVLSVVLAAAVSLSVGEGSLWVLASTAAVASAIVVLFGKLAPVGIASRHADKLARIVSTPLRFLMTLASPAAKALSAFADLVVGPVSERDRSCTVVVTEEDIREMIDIGGEEGSLEEEEKELLHKVFEFGDTVASESMRPRTEIVSVSSTATIRDVLALISEYGYSRYPVIEGTVDTVVGILYIKDILIAMSAGEIGRDDGIQRFIRPAYFIPENKRVSELLAEMQRDKFQIAIVIDEFGGTAGLVTLEDLIEEIVGSIHDELDMEEKEVEIVDEKTFVVAGQSELEEVNELIGGKLQSREFHTFGGFVFGLFGRMPKVGEQLRYRDLKFEVLEIDGRKIEKVKITKL